MSIESDVFRKSILNKEKLLKYGFKKDDSLYKYYTILLDDFIANITINDKNIDGKIYDKETNEEYTNFRVKNINGEFVNKVKEEYIKILKDINDNCFDKKYFNYDQANRITDLIKKEYKITPEFLWDKFPGYAVFRCTSSKKWFAVILNVPKNKITGNSDKEIEILNIKLGDNTNLYLKEKNVYPSYHMNKKNWVTIILDDSLGDDVIMSLINISYELENVKNAWLVPANPNYFDIIHAFDDTDEIIWKQTASIKCGDIIYLYIGAPYSKIMYKCVTTKTDIPYNYKNKNLKVNKAMTIKLLKKYQDEFTYKVLKNYGISSIRSQRKIKGALLKELDK